MAKYTDEQIKMALELCVNWKSEYCLNCPLTDECDNDSDALIRNTLDLIKRQEAEIERLEKENNHFAGVGKLHSEIKAEAIKEFWEDLKKQSFQGCDCAVPDDVVFVEDGDDLVKEMVGESK